MRTKRLWREPVQGMRSGGLAAWSIRHPVSTVMLTLTIVVLGFFAVDNLRINLLPHLIYPQIAVRVSDPGVSATIMEDRVTRQLEEQLAITEDTTWMTSTTTEGQSRVTLGFEYGKDIDIALRDASTRLDRAKRFLPTAIDPPVIYKRDPAQIPVMEFSVSSPLRDSVALRTWVDHVFSKRFISIPGVAAVEVGGGLEREIHILVDQRRLAGLGLSIDSIIQTVKKGNQDMPSGRLLMSRQEYGSRTTGKLNSLSAVAALPIALESGDNVSLSELAQVIDTHKDERLRIRHNGVPAVKVSIQKQPTANTVEVSNRVHARLEWLKVNGWLPEDISVNVISDQSIYVRHSLSNAALAALSGAALAMLVVYLFLGNVRGTLIIGSAIPISIMITFVLMALAGLTFNIMTLGGLALGIGMLIDNTIVMLENISRYKKQEVPEQLEEKTTTSPSGNLSDAQASSVIAAGEVNSAIVAATSTNLAAVIPFLFIGGLVGLLFRELIFTISAAIIGSLFVALTLVPSLAARMKQDTSTRMHEEIDRLMERVQAGYARFLKKVLAAPGRIVIVAILILAASLLFFVDPGKQTFLPKMDDGRIYIKVTLDAGVDLDEMDASVLKLEDMIHAQGNVESVFSLVGGWVFGRTVGFSGNSSRLEVQLVPLGERTISSEEWVRRFKKSTKEARMAGVRVRAKVRGLRGLRTSHAEDDISIRIHGPDLEALSRIGDDVVSRINDIKGLRNLQHSAEDNQQELAIKVDRKRAAELGLDIAAIGRTLRIALEGVVVSGFQDGDRVHPIRVRLPREEIDSPMAMGGILLFGEYRERPAIYLRDVATTEFVPVPRKIERINQSRYVEISASLKAGMALGEVMSELREQLADYQLADGYTLYFSGTNVTLEKSKSMARILIALALFLVFVVMAIQYESIRNPTIILLCVPFALIGVVIGLLATNTIISMPVWLGVIMLIGMVVNNAIVLVEYIEIMRERGLAIVEAIIEAGKLRIRPILMTTITTVVGMLPLAMGLGEGAEMLQPLAVTMVFGLSFSMLVSLLLLPAIYWLFQTVGKARAELINLRPVA